MKPKGVATSAAINRRRFGILGMAKRGASTVPAARARRRKARIPGPSWWAWLVLIVGVVVLPLLIIYLAAR